MKKLITIIILFLLATTCTYASSTNNFLGPIVSGQITTPATPTTATSFILELGPRNYRANGTVGWAYTPHDRIKVSADLLRQDIDYSFFSGTSREWMNQIALGANYQYAMGNSFQNYFDLGGYYSHAPSRVLNPISGVGFIDNRRVAGSTGFGLNPGVTLHLWRGGETNFALNYDDVLYDNLYHKKIRSSGFGGTAGITQTLNKAVNIGLSAALRAPFNAYHAEIDWNKPMGANEFTVGFFGDYTQGKHELPNTSLVGLNLKYAIDSASRKIKRQAETFATWMAKPAIYMPQVLAISEDQVQQTACALPIFSGPIPNNTEGFVPTPFSFNTGAFFSGNIASFSSSTLPAGLSIDPTTGIISGTTTTNTNVTVTATNSCGSTSSNLFLLGFIP